MPEGRRRALPDNLDPLVDTLSNVVGILVVVVALTQIQVGDALDRLIELDASRLPGARTATSAIEEQHASLSDRLAAAEERREAVLRRSSGDVADAIRVAERVLQRVEDQSELLPASDVAATDGVERALADRRADLVALRAALEEREAYAEQMRQVPKELVARLPDPDVVTGEEAWILCRYGRCYLADRSELVQAGSRAIGEVLLRDGRARNFRPDEIESVAHHFRKRDIGHGNFRWRLVPGPQTLAQVEWRSRDPGIDRTRLGTSLALRRWLAERDAEKDFIRFQVWNDSFEVYLEARQVIEAAGFRAGWVGFAEDRELELYLTFDRPPPREGPVEVD